MIEAKIEDLSQLDGRATTGNRPAHPTHLRRKLCKLTWRSPQVR